MNFDLPPESLAWRDEVRVLLDEHVTPELVAEISELGVESMGREAAKLRRAMTTRGWFGLNWPREYGGSERSAVDQYLLVAELEARGVPSVTALPITVTCIGPTILRFGTDANRKEWIPRIVSGEVDMAFGYSEPSAGSDLASLRTRAVLDGDHWVINGQKIWNTGGHTCTHEWLAVRTEPDAPKHKGISILVVPIDSPGVEVQPMQTWGGYRTNQVFLDDVRVPAGNLIGERGAGWRYITSVLDFDRVITPAGFIAGTRARFDQLVQHVRATERDGRPLAADPWVRRRLAELHRDLEVARLMALRAVSMLDSGEPPSKEASMLKVVSSELQAKVGDFGTQVLGLAGQLDRHDEHAPPGDLEWLYRQAPAMRIVTGANEIQRNVIAQRGLGLPR